MPVNHKLNAVPDAAANPATRLMIEQWARLHAIRTALGIAATIVYLWALN